MRTLPATDRQTVGMLSADPFLEHVTRTIVEHLRPKRIVLFGSRARGDATSDSDYDIMVEVETDLPGGEREHAVYDLFPKLDSEDGWSLDVHVHTPEEIELWKDDVGVVMYDIVREGLVLYSRPDVADGDAVRANPGWVAPRVSERPRGVPRSLGLWMRRAENDFATMERMATSNPAPWEVVCFHAHQSVEKLLKACLVARWARPPRTHDLGKLLDACRHAGLDLRRLQGRCKPLQALYSRSRYPKEPEPTASDAETAMAAATALRDAVLPILSAYRHAPSRPTHPF